MARDAARLALALAVSLGLHLTVVQFQLSPASGPRAESRVRTPTDSARRLDATLSTRQAISLPDASVTPQAPWLAPPVRSTPKITPDPRPAVATTQLSTNRHRPGAVPYRPANQLDVRPLIRGGVFPEYPESLVPGTVATVRLAVMINSRGEVDFVRVTGSSGVPEMDSSASTAFLSAQYRPGEIAGRHVPAVIDVEVWFGRSPPARPSFETPTPVPSAVETPPTPRRPAAR